MINSNLKMPFIIGTQSKKYGDKVLMYDRKKVGDEWIPYSWNRVNEMVNRLANAMLALGVKEQETVAQFSQNKSENIIVDFALYSIRAIMVPIYPTSTQQQLDFIIKDANIRYIFVGDQTQYDIAEKVREESGQIEKIILFEKDIKVKKSNYAIYLDELMAIGELENNQTKIDQLREKVEEKDTLCILYTSGTSGNPKGVILTYEMYHEAFRIHKIRLTQINDTDVSLAFLPLTHVFERSWTYLMIFFGATIYINHLPMDIQQTIKDVRPTLMTAVPRFWEKVYIGVNDVLMQYSPIMLGIVTWALAVGKKYNLDTLRIGKKPNKWLKLRYKIADKLVFSKVKKTLGLENAKALPVAGAKLSDEINILFQSIGVPIVYGYGLTETTATVSCYKTEYEIGTVGTIMPDLQIKIGENSEILLKGKTITPGYFNNEQANKEAFTEDGWFRTGDAGYLKNNRIILTERIKDLFKTSNGKYIAPQEIETRLGMDKYIEQIAVIADERNFVTAIISPNIEALKEYAKKNQINYSTKAELIHSETTYKLIEERIAKQQKGMANYEQIKKFTLIDMPFSIETGELTNTLKIRRAVIMQKYKSKIDSMYN